MQLAVHIFQFRMVNGACLTMAINGWLFLTQIYYIPTLYQLVYGYSAIRAGALLLPLTLVQGKFGFCQPFRTTHICSLEGRFISDPLLTFVVLYST
jgi:hypothetical protein